MNRPIDRRTALHRLAGCAAGAALAHPLLLPLAAQAQGALPDGWPNKPVKLVIPSGAGAQTDIFARYVGDHLAKVFGQPFVA